MSPIIRGATVKGPADRLMAAAGIEVSCAGVASIYADICGTLLVDESDADRVGDVEATASGPRWPRSSCATPTAPPSWPAGRSIWSPGRSNRPVIELVPAARGSRRSGPASCWPRCWSRRRPPPGRPLAGRRLPGGDPEGRVEGRRPPGAARPDRPRRPPAAGGGGVRPHPAPAGRPHHLRDPPRLRLRQRRRRPLQRRRRLGGPPAGRRGPLGPAHPGRDPGRTPAWRWRW